MLLILLKISAGEALEIFQVPKKDRFAATNLSTASINSTISGSDLLIAIGLFVLKKNIESFANAKNNPLMVGGALR